MRESQLAWDIATNRAAERSREYLDFLFWFLVGCTGIFELVDPDDIFAVLEGRRNRL